MRVAKKTSAPAAPAAETVDVPIDPINEQVVVAAALVDCDTRKWLSQRLRPESFLVPAHAAIWEGVRELVRRDLDYSPETLHQITAGKADANYAEQLAGMRSGLPPNLRHHVDQLARDRARAACATGALPAFVDALRDPSTPFSRLVSAARAIATALEGAGTTRELMVDPVRLEAEAEGVLDVFERRYYGYNLPGLDFYEDGRKRLTTGTMSGMNTLVTACSGCGKSEFLQHLALAQGPGIPTLGVEGLGRKVLYCAWEMPPKILANTMAVLYSGVDRNRIYSGQLTEGDRAELRAARERVNAYVRFLRLPRPESNDEALDLLHATLVDSGCDLAIYDLLERIFEFKFYSDEKKVLERYQAIHEETGVHGVAACQQTLKEVEKRPDKRPSRDTIKGPSTWVDVADTILGSHRPAKWKNVPDDRAELLILKQRYGKWPMLVECDYDANTGTLGEFRSAEFERGQESAADDFLAGGDRPKRKAKGKP